MNALLCLALIVPAAPPQAPLPPQAPPAARSVGCPAGHPDCPCGCLETGVCTCGTPKADADGWVEWKTETDAGGKRWTWYVKYAKPAPAPPLAFPAGAFTGTGLIPATRLGGGAGAGCSS